MTEDPIIRAQARVVLEQSLQRLDPDGIGGGWSQGTMLMGGRRGSFYCTVGVVRQHVFSDPFTNPWDMAGRPLVEIDPTKVRVYQTALQALNEAAGISTITLGHVVEDELIDWNDASDRVWSEVREAFRGAIEALA